MEPQEQQSDFNNQCAQLSLDPKRIRLHQTRIQAALTKDFNQAIPIVDTCRYDNQGILNISDQNFGDSDLSGVASFTPSAGASSRYYKPLEHLKLAIAEQSMTQLKSAIAQLDQLGAKDWPLPEHLRDLVQNQKFESVNFEELNHEISLPKALLPCVQEGNSFLNLKLQEDLALDFLEHHSFVIAPHMEKTFTDAMQKESFKKPWNYFVQGPKQSTIRFDDKGKPFQDESGYSMVPAGHGTLASFLPEISQKHPAIHSALIRNIDNVIGTSEQVLFEVKKIVSFHNFLLKNVQKIRQLLDDNQIAPAEKIAESLLQQLPISVQPVDTSSNYRHLMTVQRHLFHFNDSMVSARYNGVEGIPLLQELFRRPVNTMGMVPNTEVNVGGAPVFTKFNHMDIKLCIEAPHVSLADQRNFLAKPEKSTHFNPVFLLAETQYQPENYFSEKDSSWLLAKKNYKGQNAYYHESALYELLSHSLLANVVFVDIPRLLFNPHKSLQGTAGRSLSAWVPSSYS